MSSPVIGVMLDVANGKPWCRPSVIAIQVACGYKSERSVQNGLAWLKAAGYIDSDGGHGDPDDEKRPAHERKYPRQTAIRRFLPRSARMPLRVQNVEPAPVAPSTGIAPKVVACIYPGSLPELLVSPRVQPEPEPPAVEPEPQPVVDDGQVVVFEGGASYNPAWSVLDASPKGHPAPEPAHERMPEAAPAPVRYVPPTGLCQNSVLESLSQDYPPTIGQSQAEYPAFRGGSWANERPA